MDARRRVKEGAGFATRNSERGDRAEDATRPRVLQVTAGRR